MGNFVSCSFIKGEPNIAKIIDLNGETKNVNLPLTVAELMLEEQGHMVSSADDIRRTSRFPAMRADEELFARKIYVLVPMVRVKSKVSEFEMGLIMAACEKRRVKRRRSSSKVLPDVVVVPEEDVKAPVEVLIGGDDNGGGGGGGGCQRLRQWTPSLEPVSEED